MKILSLVKFRTRSWFQTLKYVELLNKNGNDMKGMRANNNFIDFVNLKWSIILCFLRNLKKKKIEQPYDMIQVYHSLYWS